MFWAAELNFQGALGYLRGFNQVDNQMGGGISSVSRTKMFEVSSLRVDMGNPSLGVDIDSPKGHEFYRKNSREAAIRLIK